MADIRQQCPDIELTIHQVNKWGEKGAILAKYQHAVLLAAQYRGFPVTADLIVALHAPERKSQRNNAA
ncbi:MAG: hypothetical protein ACPG61_10265 [Paracoccaceae bacterium]